MKNLKEYHISVLKTHTSTFDIVCDRYFMFFTPMPAALELEISMSLIPLIAGDCKVHVPGELQ